MEKLCGFLFRLLAFWVGGALCFPAQPVPKDLPSHNRTLRELSCNNGEYLYEDWCCQNCPPGSYVVNHCTGDHQPSSCGSCTLGQDFTNSANGLEQCISCRVCRQDEVLVHPCTLTGNAVCECKLGTYCTPEMCEICVPCSRCGKGKRVKEQCNATRNTVCEDIPQTQPTSNTTSTYLPLPTSTKDMTTAPKKDVTKHINSTHEKDVTKDPDPKSETNYFTPFIIALIIVLLLFLALCGWGLNKLYRKREKQNRSNAQNLLANNSADPSTNSSLTSLPLADRANQGVAGPRMEVEPLLTSNNVSNCVTEPTEHSCTQGPKSDDDPGGDDCGGGARGTTKGNEPCSDCDQLPPCECYWTRCFHSVIDVCQEHIIRIMRELRVPNNKIDCIIKDNPGDRYEQCYKLLQLWRTIEGKQASMDKVIRVLTDMEMRGLAENIINSIRSKNITIA